MSFDRKRSAGYLANHLARLFARAIYARIRPLGLSPGTFPAMLELWAEDGLTQRDLVQRLDIEQATMANTLARMERDGLVKRSKDAHDGRVQRVWLTAAGRALEAPAIAAAEAVNSEALAVLPAHERQKFRDAMAQVIAGFHRDS